MFKEFLNPDNNFFENYSNKFFLPILILILESQYHARGPIFDGKFDRRIISSNYHSRDAAIVASCGGPIDMRRAAFRVHFQNRANLEKGLMNFNRDPSEDRDREIEGRSVNWRRPSETAWAGRGRGRDIFKLRVDEAGRDVDICWMYRDKSV